MNSLLTVIALIMGAGCDKSAAPPPMVTASSEIVAVTGTERLGWDQRAAGAAELATIKYAVYLDANTRVELTDASCSRTASAAGYACSARLPPMTPGNHTLQLISYFQNRAVHESLRSDPLRVNVTGRTSSSAARAT